MKKSTFLILCLEGALLSFNVAAAAALVPSIAKDFALSQFIAGRIIWFYMLPYGLAALLYGPLVRRVEAKKVEMACIFFFSLSNLLAGLAGGIRTLFIARFFMGLFGASVIPLALILIARQIEGEKRGRSVGLFFSTTFFASLIGLFLSGLVSWRLIFLIPASSGFLLLIPMYFYLPDFGTEKEKFRFHYLAAFRQKSIVRIFTYIFCTSLFYHGIQQWLGVYFSTGCNLSQFVISMLITLTSLSGIFGEVGGGLLADSFGRIRTVNLGIICMVCALLALTLRWPVFILALIMAVWGLGWTFNHAAVSTILTDLPKGFLNEAASLNSGVRFISGGLGAVFGGMLMQRSFSFGFLAFAAGLILLGIFSKNLLASRD